MRFVKLWLPALVGMVASLSQASALPVPKLPPEATDKPSVVVRVRPIAELLKDVAYVAKMVGQEEVFNAFEPGMQPVLDILDTQKAVGFYAKIGPNGVDSHGVLLLPVKNQKDFIALLNQFGVNPNEGEGGLWTVNVPGAPFPVIFRFANGYAYGTMKNTPDAEAGLKANKIYAPEALFKAGDDSVFSITFNADAVPNDLKRRALQHLEDGLRDVRANELPKEPNAAVRAFMDTALEELATKAQSLLVDTQTMVIRLDLDRKKEDLGFGVRLIARPGTDLAADLATVGTGKSLGAGILTPNAAVNFTANIEVPKSLKKSLDPLIDEFVAQAWKKAPGEKEQALAEEALELLAPTLKAGVLDVGVELRGPDAQNHLAMLILANIKSADRFEPLVRKARAAMPADEQKILTLDIDKSAGVNLHQIAPKANQNDDETFGPNPQVVAAFRKDAVVIGLGSLPEATAVVKGAIESKEKASTTILEGMASIRRLAPVMERKDPGAIDAAKKAYPAGINDVYRLSVTGGQSLDIRFTSSARIIQFGMLLEQARRNR